MTPERWSRLREVFGAALSIPEMEWPRFLESACGADTELRAEVELLLAGNREPSLRSPATQALQFSVELAIGETIGQFRIESKLGQGGMGVVYRAYDARLHRYVALKVLPQEHIDAPERRKRLMREAQAASALNHPNIVTVYEVGSESDVDFIAMECVEGGSLDHVIAGKGLRQDRALTYAQEILAALAKAHAAGVIHRDLKPANIMVTADGHIKLLDFGVARNVFTAESKKESLTAEGEIVGTIAYMSPEQVRGLSFDQRTDLFSFGLVLYEMLTGKRAFEGSSSASLIAAIIDRPAPSIAEIAPPALDRALQRCLKKDPDERWQTARDLKAELEWIAASHPETAAASARFSVFSWVAIAVATVIALLSWTRVPKAGVVGPNDVTFSISAPSRTTMGMIGALNIDRISPDGSMILFRVVSQGRSRFCVRRLNSLESEILGEWNFGGDPFWAPDSQSIAFPVLDGTLMKMRIPKGAPELIESSVAFSRGGTWGEKGVILFAGGNGTHDTGETLLLSVPAAGGTPKRVEVRGLRGGSYYNPEFLPGGEDFLFEYVPNDVEGAQVYIATLSAGKAVNLKLLLSNETAAAFTPAGGGRLLFVRSDNLYAVRFDRKAGRLSGDPDLLQERVASSVGPRNAYFSVAQNGTLAWRSGPAVATQIAVFDRTGNRIGSAGPPLPADAILLSPDESHLIASGEAGSWVVEMNGMGRVGTKRRTDEGFPFWSRDGSELIFIRGNALVARAVNGSGSERKLAEVPNISADALSGVFPDARHVLIVDETGVFLLTLDENHVMKRLVGQQSDIATISPDGRWVLYKMTRGDPGLYVQPVSSASLPRQIAPNGQYPVWRADGREILYYDPTGPSVSSIRVDGAETSLRFGTPQPLFKVGRPRGYSSSRPLGVNRDGSRIYLLQPSEEPDAGVIQVRLGAIR